MTRPLRPNLLVAALSAGLLLANGADAACNDSVDGFLMDWNAQSWTTGGRSGTVSAARIDPTSSATMPVSVTFSGDTARFLSGYPVKSNLFTGGYGSAAQALNYAVDFQNNSQTVTLTLTFPEAVENLDFTLFDVDSLEARYGSGGFRDGVIIEATGPGGSVAPQLAVDQQGTTIYIGSALPSNYALGYYGNAGNNSDDGNLYVSFAAPVTQVIIRYTNGIYAPSSNPDPQGVGLYDLNFCVPRAPVITATKTLKVFSENMIGCDQIPGTPDPQARHALPGACIEYRITAQNIGDGTSSAVTLIDTLDPNFYFIAATLSGFSSGGAGYAFSTPATQEDCASGCTVSLTNASLSPGQSGEILIRAIIK